MMFEERKKIIEFAIYEESNGFLIYVEGKPVTRMSKVCFYDTWEMARDELVAIISPLQIKEKVGGLV